MAQIQINPKFIWTNGIEKEAIILNAHSIQDNLENEAKFYFTLIDNNNFTITAGNISIVGDDYDLWKTNNFSTEHAITYICQQLNLIPIIPTTKK